MIENNGGRDRGRTGASSLLTMVMLDRLSLFLIGEPHLRIDDYLKLLASLLSLRTEGLLFHSSTGSRFQGGAASSREKPKTEFRTSLNSGCCCDSAS
jgi:hypothetical protein